MREERTGRCGTGYCFSCLELGTKYEVVMRSSRPQEHMVGWECPRCGGVSSKLHRVCPVHGVGCRLHVPLDDRAIREAT